MAVQENEQACCVAPEDSVEFETARLRGLPARFEAQKIAFGPVVFQCVRIALRSGLLARIDAAGEDGVSIEQLAQNGGLSAYAISVVLETALSAGVVRRRDGLYTLTRVGDYVLHDELTQVNIDYIHDVCYQGLYLLEESLRSEKPVGLRTLGPWPTIYEGLSKLPQPARGSWFAFDHHYSDSAFAEAISSVFARAPRTLMDIGANTGKWSLRCLQYDRQVQVTLVDHAIQLARAKELLESAGLAGRARFHAMDVLDDTLPFPQGMDAVWMSQFLTCFGLDAVGHIFRRVVSSLAHDGVVWVLDTFWDRQKYDIASYCLINTSPYFTAMASGNSKMHESSAVVSCAEANGLRLVEAIDNLGVCHSLLRFEKAIGQGSQY